MFFFVSLLFCRGKEKHICRKNNDIFFSPNSDTHLIIFPFIWNVVHVDSALRDSNALTR